MEASAETEACLSDIRVIDFSTGITGAYATKLFADAGADVVKVEPSEGDPLRRRAPHGEDLKGKDAPLFRYLNAGKRSIVGAPDDPSIVALGTAADLVVECGNPVMDVDTWRRAFPHLVVLSLSPFGRHGPYAGRLSTPFTVEAESGSLACRGLIDGEPYQVGCRLFEWAQGTFGAVGALAAVMRSKVTGRGEHVDATLLLAAHFAGAGGRETINPHNPPPRSTEPPRVVEVPSIEPTSDGWVGFNTNSYQQLSDFLVMIGQSELLEENDEWAHQVFRFAHIDEWNKVVRDWTLEHTTDEVIELASLFRIPVAPVNNGKTVLNFEQFVARGSYGTSPDGDFIQPEPPARIDGRGARIRGVAPRLGEHTGQISGWDDRNGVASGRAPLTEPQPALPFHGLRVLDATAWWAGPAMSSVFAALGADVIHLESIQRPDGMRLMVNKSQRTMPQWWERGARFLATNANKRDLTLNLADDEGRRLLQLLLQSCDVLVENFSPRVFEAFGMTPECVLGINPNIVYVRMPAFGVDGPWRDNVGFAQTMEQATGLAWLTGHPYDQPRVPRGPCDPVAGYHGAFAAMTALHRRSRLNAGAFVESAFVEAIFNCAAEPLVTYTASGVVMEREGNRSPEAAPQGLYPADGWEEWVAISVVNDAQWEAFRQVLGRPAWAMNAALDNLDGRRAAHDLIDEELRVWTATRNVGAIVDELLSAGIPAGALQDPTICRRHPQMRALGYFEEVEHPIADVYITAGLPFQYASVDDWIRTPAPTFGQHNHDILHSLLGLSDAEIESLEEGHVIGDRPLGA
jgi:crotonobetainyl-CoA:carnitine CoA-transferase CaiB-like acyl-CoA transferase